MLNVDALDNIPDNVRVEIKRLQRGDAVLRELIDWWRGDVIDLPALVKITDKARDIERARGGGEQSPTVSPGAADEER